MPLLNPLEMNNPDKATVVDKVRAKYSGAFRTCSARTRSRSASAAFDHVTEALAAFERTRALRAVLVEVRSLPRWQGELDEREQRGLAIFEDRARGNCASCHPNRPERDGTPPLFTNFGYANLGVPRFNDSPFFTLPAELNPDGEHFVDHGLAKTSGDPRHDGMFRVPTLRNVSRPSPYGHNGYVRQLDEMIAFEPRAQPRGRPRSRRIPRDINGRAGAHRRTAAAVTRCM